MGLALNDLRKEREQIYNIARKYGADNIRIFGSTSRGEERQNSDLDFLVDFEADRSLLDVVGLKMELEELLRCKVDLVTEGAIHQMIVDQIMKEAVPL